MSETSNPAPLSADDLHQFTGTEHWYRHGLVRNILYTDGVKYVADSAGAHWLIDEIALAQCFERKIAGQPFQLWKLSINQESRSAMLSCQDGNGNEILTKPIVFTDFPLKEISLYVCDNVILLPSEY